MPTRAIFPPRCTAFCPPANLAVDRAGRQRGLADQAARAIKLFEAETTTEGMAVVVGRRRKLGSAMLIATKAPCVAGLGTDRRAGRRDRTDWTVMAVFARD